MRFYRQLEEMGLLRLRRGWAVSGWLQVSDVQSGGTISSIRLLMWRGMNKVLVGIIRSFVRCARIAVRMVVVIRTLCSLAVRL
jgi:hypothetical protein